MSFEPTRLCRKCGERRYVGDFPFLASGNQSSHCDFCRKGYLNQWKSSDHGKRIIRKHNKKAQREKRAMCLLAAAKRRSKQKGVPFNVSDGERARLQSVIDRGVCEMTGLPFKMDNPNALFCWDSPSIDRINPKRGYVDGNMRVVLYGMNAAIGPWGEATLEHMARAWLSRK